MHNQQIRDRLQQRRIELRNRADRAGEDLRGESLPVEGGFADNATAHANDAVLEVIRDSAEAELQQIDRALRRINDGVHGFCEKCGASIGEARLEAVPYATTCIGCAS